VVTLSSTTTGATFTWSAVQPTGIIGVATSGTNTIPAQTLVNSTNAPITVTYTARATTNGSSACLGSVYNYTITVNPKPRIEDQLLILCSEENFVFSPVNAIPIATTIVPIGTNYSWTITTNTNIIGASAGFGTQISQNLVNTSNTIQDIKYTVSPIFAGCSGNPFIISISVFPKPNILFSIPNQIVCNETATSLVTLASSTQGSISFEWTASVPSGISGASLSGTNIIPAEVLINSTNSPLIINYSAKATFSNNGKTCQGQIFNYTTTVNPTFISTGIVSNYNGYNVSIFGGNDGFINLTTLGGSGAYTFSWIGPNGYLSATEDISFILAGTYTVTINDGYCSPLILTFILTQPPELLVRADLALNINLKCFGDTNGAIGIIIKQESVSPYDYELYDSSGILLTTILDSTNLNPQFTGLIAGTYSIKIIDANGGFKVVNELKVSQPDTILLTSTSTPVTCYGGNNATISINVTGGTAPFQAKWDNLATGFYQNNLSAGNYTIVVTDANNCTKSIVVNIAQAPLFDVNPVVSNISCFGANDGSIVLNFVGGISPVNLVWSDGSTAGTTRNNLKAGVYSVVITDAKPCTISRSFTIMEPKALSLSANLSNALDCNDANSGAINLLVSGGTPPFTYSWNNRATTEDLTSIAAGNYLVTVIDARNCSATGNYAIFRPSPIVVKVDTRTDFNCETKIVKQSFIAKVSGGFPPYQFIWSSGTGSGLNNEIMNTAQNGLVLLDAIDSRGCKATYTFDVAIPELGSPSFTTTSIGISTYGFYSIDDPIKFNTTATGNFINVGWDFGDGTFSNELNPSHIFKKEGAYTVVQTVTYPFGCVYVSTITILLEKGYKLIPLNGFTPNNDGVNDYFAPLLLGLNAIQFSVYDTWGALVYAESGDTIRGWDGNINNKEAENGNYYYKILAKTFYGKLVKDQGAVVLIK
jgi:gliding motility-associated-like protein